MGKFARQSGPVKLDSPASTPLHFLLTELLAARAHWGDLGVKVAKGYNKGLELQKRTLNEMKKAKTASSVDALVFVLQALSVGYAGGLVGGLIAPWVKDAADQVTSAFRTALSGAAQQYTKDVTKAIVGAAEAELITPPSDPYTPVTPETIAVDLEIRDRIGSAFGPVENAVQAMIAKANAVNAEMQVGQVILSNFRQNCPLLRDAPEPKDMPNDVVAARAAELAMWVAWANERDWDWWQDVFNILDRPDNANEDEFDAARTAALELVPVALRMSGLGKQAFVMTRVNRPEYVRDGAIRGGFQYVDLRKLRKLPVDDGTLPFRKLSGLSFQWDKTKPLQRAMFLSRLQDVTPIYKGGSFGRR